MNKTIRNLIIFAIVAIGGGFLGMALDRLNPPADPMQGLGVLIWLVSPLLANLLLRALGGDGWQDFGLAPHLKTGWHWYLATALIVLLVTAVPLTIGSIFGAVVLSELTQQAISTLLWLVGSGFVAAMAKNIFEEFAWRGYLTPRFASLGLHPFVNALLTGWIWAAWHIPYYLYYLDRTVLQKFTTLSLPVFILVAFLVLPFHALAYGELRLLSKSVWPGWLLHNIANALTFALISGGLVVVARNFAGLLLSPGTDGVIHSLLMGLIGFALYRYRKQVQSGEKSL